MLTYSQAFYDLKNKLQPLYDGREAEAMAHEILHYITHLTKTERLISKDTSFTDTQKQQFDNAVKELLTGKPLQYVTGSAWFMGREFMVNGSVLIPRPETEELVNWILSDYNSCSYSPNVLDVGTGSGCIPISLKLNLTQSKVTTCDVSKEALKLAAENAKRLNADIRLAHLDFLDGAQRNKLEMYDVIVSNPPYIPFSEKERMHINVTAYEPGIALFVSDDDALVFYRAIAMFGREHLSSKGNIYCELDAAHAFDCQALFKESGYTEVEIKKDMHGNWRMLKAAMQ